MAENKTIRLNKVLRELNISLDRAVEHLASKGVEVEARPTTKISNESMKFYWMVFRQTKIKRQLQRSR